MSSSGGQQLTVPGLRIERHSCDSKQPNPTSASSPQPISQSMVSVLNRGSIIIAFTKVKRANSWVIHTYMAL